MEVRKRERNEKETRKEKVRQIQRNTQVRFDTDTDTCNGIRGQKVNIRSVNKRCLYNDSKSTCLFNLFNHTASTANVT
jgi:hypothetical protein